MTNPEVNFDLNPRQRQVVDFPLQVRPRNVPSEANERPDFEIGVKPRETKPVEPEFDIKVQPRDQQEGFEIAFKPHVPADEGEFPLVFKERK